MVFYLNKGKGVESGVRPYRHQMEVPGHLHTPADFSPEETVLVSTEWQAGWVSDRVCTFWRREKYVPPPGIEPPFQFQPLG